MFSSSSTQSSVSIEEKKIPPPRSLEEWLERNKLTDWPHDIVDEDIALFDEHDAHNIIGSACDIRSTLNGEIGFQLNILNEIETQTIGLESKLNEYSHLFFQEAPMQKKAQNKTFEKNKKYRDSMDMVMAEDNKKKDAKEMQEFFQDVVKQRTIENASFGGYCDDGLTPLPSGLEAPQILNQITKLQPFTHSQRKVWQRYYLSEASVAIFQDAFWLVFLLRSKEKDCEDRSLLFNRISNHFVSLFLSVSVQEKDFFFQHYTLCLCQAIYMAMCEAFLDSIVKFDDRFRAHIINTVYEWTTGNCPNTAEVLASWDIGLIHSLVSSSQYPDENKKKKALKTSLSFDPDTFLAPHLPKPSAEMCDVIQLVTPVQKQSHARQGPRFERIAFNIAGRSPLIAHYLQSKNLWTESDTLQRIVTRTSQSSEKHEGETYNDFLSKYLKSSKSNKARFEKLKVQSTNEYKCESSNNMARMKSIQRLHEDILKSHKSIKILSDQVLALHRQLNFAKRITKESINEEEEKDES